MAVAERTNRCRGKRFMPFGLATAALAATLLLAVVGPAQAGVAPDGVVATTTAPYVDSMRNMVQRETQINQGLSAALRITPPAEYAAPLAWSDADPKPGNGLAAGAPEFTAPWQAKSAGPAEAEPLYGFPAGWQAINYADEGSLFGSQWIPPDTMGAIGPNHFVEVINGAVAIYTRAGVRLSAVSLANFFTMAGGYPRDGAYDPRVLYDRASGRWFACALEFSNRQDNHIVLAVSATSDPTGVWNKYVIGVGESTVFTDYDTLGVDRNGVYFAVRMFPAAGSSWAKIIATRKASLIAAAPSLGTWWYWNNITDMFSVPQPAHNEDVIGTAGYAWLVASSPVANANVRYRAVWWTATGPLSTFTQEVVTPAFGNTMNAPASGSTTNVNVGDSRLQTAHIRNGRLWTSRTVGVNANGGSSTPDRTACEWLVLDVSAPTTATLDQSGRVYDPSATGWRYYYYPSVMVSGQGNAVMGFSGSKSTEYVAAFASWRLASYAAGTMTTPTRLRVGSGPYTRLDGSGRNRWGDYSHTTLDPNDDMTIWTIQEYAHGTNNWGTWVSAWQAVYPILNAPSVVPYAILNTVNNAATYSGSYFYDPGPGYVGRISSAISGDGISGLTTTYNNPNSVTLRFNVSSTATQGARNVTIINPDGQSYTRTNALFIKRVPSFSFYLASGAPGDTVDLKSILASGATRLANKVVTFYVDGLNIGNATTDANGLATKAYLIPAAATYGYHTVLCYFNGTADPEWASASRSANALLVRRPTAISLYTTYAIPGQTVDLRAILAWGATRLAGKTVYFSIDGTAVGSAVTDANGIATKSYVIPAALAYGWHDLTATFYGDTDYGPSTRTASALLIRRPTAFSMYITYGLRGQTVPLRAILLWGATRLAGKAVYFYVDGAYVGAATTDALGVAARGYTIPADAAYGPHNVMVYFGGDTDYASTSRTAPVLIVRRPTAISFFASRGRPGDRIQLRALLTSEGVGVAGKTMTFYVSGVMIGTATTDASGVAAIDYSIPLDAKPGVYDVGATFAGDNDYAPSGRTAAVLTVL